MDGTDSGDDGRDEPTWVEKREGEWRRWRTTHNSTDTVMAYRNERFVFFKEEDEGGELTDGDDKWTASDARELNRYQLKRDGQV